MRSALWVAPSSMGCLARTLSSRASCLSFANPMSPSSSCTSLHAAPDHRLQIWHVSPVNETACLSSLMEMQRMCSRLRYVKRVKRQVLRNSWRWASGLKLSAGSDNASTSASNNLESVGIHMRSSVVASTSQSRNQQFRSLTFSQNFCNSSGLRSPGKTWKQATSVESLSAEASVAPIALSPSVSNEERANSKSFERLACPGCGIYMQDKDPKEPGFFKRPAALDKVLDDFDEAGEAEDDADDIYEDEDDESDLEELEASLDEGKGDGKKDGIQMEIPDWGLEEDDDDDEIDLREAGFQPWNEVGGSKQAAKDAWLNLFRGKTQSEGDEPIDSTDEEEKLVVCARCHALRHYGKVKDESLENLLPDFDFERVVGSRLKKAYGRRAVVVLVVDGSDFDGSFPRKVAAVLAEAERDMGSAWQEGKPGNSPRLVVVVNKIDLLPRQISPARLEQWVRRRSRAGGAPRLTGVHLVSAFKGWGVERLAMHLKDMAGPRGDVWVVGAQNAGKSSLINSLARITEGKKRSQLTEAAVPGTTLGVLKLTGILPARARLFDTPGLLHPHQITTRLNREEQKLVQVRKELKPRTFRVKKGGAVHVGGLLRLDLVDAPAESIYITVWASAQVPCHMGKVETAEELLEKHIGERLKPPMDKERAAELGPWVARRVTVSGDKWDASSVDVAIAGLGWVGVGVKGTAILQAWTYEGVAVTTHEAMVYDMASIFENPGSLQ